MENGDMLQKCLSVFFHLGGVHRWPEGRFVDIFNQVFGERNFPPTMIQQIWMRGYLSCNHAEDIEMEVLSPYSAEFGILLDDVCSDNRLQQLQRAARFISTSSLESHHSVALNYRPKRYH